MTNPRDHRQLPFSPPGVCDYMIRRRTSGNERDVFAGSEQGGIRTTGCKAPRDDRLLDASIMPSLAPAPWGPEDLQALCCGHRNRRDDGCQGPLSLNPKTQYLDRNREHLVKSL